MDNTYLVKAYFKQQFVGALFSDMDQYLPLSGLFEALTKLKQENVIIEFDVTRATLEQVFQAFARFQNARNENEEEEIVNGEVVKRTPAGAGISQVSPDEVSINVLPPN